ncbi:MULTISPECIES: BglG family transcription antiterminator [Pontibacillus]|uniref:BglG family transcription antiterminator n=1 Tax=Pontibacillus chungwhensis TaxID=265426 RepID=A0ABY8UWP8_9BACI|nr:MULTISPECIES: BglG family transcription antiterminator [Pontibacillus]MCD5324226.1 BglG family transcription antiterminator [Pontibacillus sp. HN14]WIF97718.1 BglG family transcription antiterminator [Pontibacillus chungwhensis]
MVLDKRRTYLLTQLYQSDTPISTKWLQKKIGVSARTVYYDIQQINDWLEDNELEEVQRHRGKGFFLTTETQMQLPEKIQLSDRWDYRLSREERKVLLTLYLLNDTADIRMKDLMEHTQMSRGSIIKDLDGIKEYFKKHRLDLQYSRSHGYFLEGAELHKRQLLSHILVSVKTDEKWQGVREEAFQILLPASFDKSDSMAFIKKVLYETEKELGIVFTDEMITVLSMQMIISIERVKNEKQIQLDEDERNAIQKTKAYTAAHLINEHLRAEGYNVFSEDETAFLAMNLLSSKVHQEPPSSPYEDPEAPGLKRVIHDMVDDFQIYSCVLFEDREQLEANLLLHLKPVYYRLKYDVPSNNELSEHIQAHYQEIFKLTKRSIIHLERYMEKPIPDEEIAYIAMHFGGWLSKEDRTIEKKYKAIIVCENGIGTSNMLKAQLEAMMTGIDVIATLSFREYQQTKLRADVIFATNFLKEKETPVIHVPALLQDVDKEYVLKQLNHRLQEPSAELDQTDELIAMIKQHATVHDEDALKQQLMSYQANQTFSIKEPYKPMLNELLTSETIQFEPSVPSWEDAITKASQPLLATGKIEQRYVDAMIDTVNELGPYIVIAPKIAIPHARPEAGVEQLGMSLLKVDEPVAFSDQEKHKANLIIVLAAIDNETHLTALSQLTTMLSEPENMEQLLNASTTEDVLSLVNNYSHV